MKRNEIIYLSIVLLLFVSCSKKEIKVACVGDSITEGAGLACQSKTAYPVILDSILGSSYYVLNCGRSGATLQKEGDLPYWTCKEFYNVFAFNPNIIIIKLGTNDIRNRFFDNKGGNNWNAENFIKDYQAMIDTFKTIPNNPKIFVCLPVPAYKNAFTISDSSICASIIPAIKNIAKVNNIPVIDLYTQMSNQSENFPDGIHPNEKGTKIMAEFIAKTVKGNN